MSSKHSGRDNQSVAGRSILEKCHLRCSEITEADGSDKHISKLLMVLYCSLEMNGC